MKTTPSHAPRFGFRCAHLFVAVFLSTAISPIFAAPPEVTIKARFVQIQPGSGWPERTDWYSKAVEASSDQTFSAMLTDVQFKDVLNTLNHRHGADLLNEGQVTTLSGRQAQFQVIDAPDIPTNSSPNASKIAAQKQTDPLTDTNWTGVTLDVVPDITPDNSAIQMTLIATIRQPVGNLAAASPPSNQLKPVLQTLQFVNKCTVPDGQTVVFGGSSGVHMADKVPVLGDLPVVGSLFTTQSGQTNKVLVFVTATLIDASGNRIHPRAK